MKNIFQTLFKIVLCVLLPNMVTGCALWPISEPAPSPSVVSSSSPPREYDAEAVRLFAQARALWRPDDICTDPEQAVLLLDGALKKAPEYAEAFLWRGRALDLLGYRDEAFDDLTRAIRLTPSAKAYAFRSLCLFKQGNLQGARKDIDQALLMDPSWHRAWNIRGAISYREGDKEAACKDFEQGCETGDCSGLNAARKEQVCR